MRLILHPKVASDVSAIMDYYERDGGPQLADDFYEELRLAMSRAAERPESFSIRDHDLRRVNLPRFPYHFLFRVVDDSVRILVVRHHRRHPALGTSRR